MVPAKIVWDAVGERFYETGVDRGVLFPVDPTTGLYGKGVPWNGLISVTESPTGAEPTPQYADNIKYLNLMSNEEFGATIEAFTYPAEFAACDGSALVAAAPGLFVGQQPRKLFGLAFRTLIGNDAAGQDLGYKIHLVYGCLAAPSEKGYTTINDSPEALTFSWAITTTSVPVEGYRPIASLVIDSRTTADEELELLEDAIYGSALADAELPTPLEVIAMLTPAPPEGG